jgi:signal transduction histidine kinase
MYGVSPADFVNKRLTETLDAEDPANIQLTRDYIRAGYRVVDRESHEVDAKGNTKVFLNSMIGIVENGMLLRTWGIQRDVTDRRLAEEALASVSRRLIEAQEQERTRIGRELHDDIGQRLSMLAIGLEQIEHDPPDSAAQFLRRIGELRNQTSKIAADLQSLSHELHSAKLEYLGIAAATRAFCKKFGEQQNAEVDINTYDLPSTLPPGVSLCLFRILQEALHNSTKHSGVRHFKVELWATPDEIHLMVSDSGVGFDRDAAKQSRGLGLISMEERLKLLNGTLSIDSQFQRGTTIHARVPLEGTDSLRPAG